MKAFWSAAVFFAPTDDGATPLFFAVVLRHKEYCDFLLKRGARLDVYSACALGKTAEASALLKADPKLAKTRDRRLRRTPLFWAARSGDAKVVKLLLDQGAEGKPARPPLFDGWQRGHRAQIVGPQRGRQSR